MMGTPQENTVTRIPLIEVPLVGIPLMEIPQKTVMGYTQEKTVMGIPQSSHQYRRNGTNSDVIVEGESPVVNLSRWSIRPLDA